MKPYFSSIVAFIAGLVCVFGFAPFGISFIPVIALACLMVVWQQAKTAKQAAGLGWLFGLGLFGAGIAWLYVALTEFGGMPLPLAVLVVFLFASFFALYSALVGYCQAKWRLTLFYQSVLLIPALWALSEWLRGWLFTGFPWLTLAYAHTNSPLAGFAPILGVYGVSWLQALIAGLLAWAWLMPIKRVYAGASIVALLLVGWGLTHISWTQPVGKPVSVALVQGNINQHLKFRNDVLLDTLQQYKQLVLQHPAQLTVLPETAFPLFRQQIPEGLLQDLQTHAKQQQGDILIGTFDYVNEQYFNAVFSIGSNAEQRYYKQHLVPFGEFIPFRSILGPLITEVLKIPMGETTRGDINQAVMNVAGQQVAVNICYEDVFGEEIIHGASKANLLVNVTNDAWYGRSNAAEQHNQISQFRALETGRMMLRATNTGLTSIIDRNGVVLAKLEQHQAGVLMGQVQGYQGLTPYMRWGNWAVVSVLFTIILLVTWYRAK